MPCSFHSDGWAPQTIDVLALELPTKHVFPGLLAFAKAAVRSPEVDARRGACIALSACAEGCSDSARRRMDDVLQVSVMVLCGVGLGGCRWGALGIDDLHVCCLLGMAGDGRRASMAAAVLGLRRWML
jgi:hypothetical protein